jgi:hypothetical protein
MQDTYKQARSKDKTITMSDIKSWYNRNLINKTNLAGYNSFQVDGPRIEYQIDLALFLDLKGEEDRKYPYVLFIIDIFDKFCSAIPIKTKQPPDVLAGIIEGIHKLGGNPLYIYSDMEGSFLSKLVQKYFKDEGIKHLTTLNHAAVVERVIRTIKAMTYKRLEYEDKENGKHEPYWWMLPRILLVYNNFKVHSVTKFTPKDARKPENIEQVKDNLQHNKVANRTYPNIEVGDHVRNLKKKDKLDKERVPIWSKAIYNVEDIVDNGLQKMYKITGSEKPLFRSEVLLIPK